MAQVSIREYDVKSMLHTYLGKKYLGIQIRSLDDIQKLSDDKKYVIKPDMLFGKRKKRGLIGINLTKQECKAWLEEHLGKVVDIDGIKGELSVFLVEEMQDFESELYLQFSLGREGDTIYFSRSGGIDIEENWESVQSITIPAQRELQQSDLEKLAIQEENLKSSIMQIWNFYRSYGFVSLEFNPIAQKSSGDFVFLDAVAKIDDQEAFRQKQNWKDLEIPESFGFREHAGERYIRELDSKTGASLKLKILNPEAKIWTLFAGGGGSLVLTDTLGHLGYANDIGNYGECSGNPSREFTREYTKILLSEMLKNKKQSKYLIIGGAIANFTYIDSTFAGVIDALREQSDELKVQKVQILVRRGGINEKQGLKLLKDACQELGIPATITGSDAYMTDILEHIQLS